MQIRAVQRQSQQESVCTITRRPVLVGLTSTPDDDEFGRQTSLSLDGTIVAIGAPKYGSENDGYVQVFRLENRAWTQLGSPIFGDPFTNVPTATFTNALSDDGSILAVGGTSTSNVRVFRLVDDEWESLGNNITNPSGAYIGEALAISGDGTILAASSPRASSNVGEVRVFELVGGNWSQKGRTLRGQGDESYIGTSISLSQDGSRLAVVIPNSYSRETNVSARVFEFIDDWVQIGQDFEGITVGGNFDRDVSLASDGTTVAVGSPDYSDGNSNNLGSVHVYRYGSNGQWLELGSMLIGKAEGEYLGESVALSGDASILVSRGKGLLRFFKANGNEWVEVGEEATDSLDQNNAAISRDGSMAMGGASVFDISCPQGTTPTTTTPVVSPPPATTRAPFPLPTSAQVEAPVKTPIGIPVLSPSPTENMEPLDDSPTLSSPTTTPAAAGTSPTSAPRTNPTADTLVEETFSDVSLSFNGVSKMSGPETELFERLTKEWYESFFDERLGRVLQALMLDARNMQTTIEVSNQNVSLSEDASALVNKITYKQTIAYTAESNNVDAKDYITLPFKDFDANTEYGEMLKSQLVAFQGVQSPLPIPQFGTITDASGDENDGESGSIAVIVGASIGGAVFLAIAAFVGIRVKKRKDNAGESRVVQHSNTPVDSQEQTSAQRSQGQSLASASGLIVYDGQGEAMAPHTFAAQAVLLESDNPSTLQKDTTEVQTPSAGSLEPAPPLQDMDTPMPEPMAVSTPSDGYPVQFKDQTRSATPELHAQHDS